MRRLLSFLLLLPFTTLLEAQWLQEWQGDLDSYDIEDNTLTHRDNGLSGRATIFRGYALEEQLEWHWAFYFADRPTQSNRFEFSPLSVSKDHFQYRYFIRPTEVDKGLALIEEVYQQIDGGWRKLTTKELSRKLFSFPSIMWQELQVSLHYNVTLGLQLQFFHPVMGQWMGDWVPIREGEIDPTFRISTIFSSKKKLNFTYLLPDFKEEEGGEPGEVHVVGYEAEDIGRLVLSLSAPVVAEGAKVTCEGYSPTLQAGATPDQLIINLGVPFTAGKTYLFQITGLHDLRGYPVSLSLTVETEERSEGQTNIPQGIYISEIMASPPSTGPLRGVKYIELYNNSGAPIQLGLLYLMYGATKYPLPMVTLAQGAYALLYLESDPYPSRLATLVPMERFPALSSSFTLSLRDPNDVVLDQVNFSSHLYGEGEPKGGASIERVTYHPDSWRRSNHPNGGTPGAPTTLKPYKTVPPKSVVINELLLSPSTTGEKYIELYNNSPQAIDLADLYLSYTNKEESQSATSWLLIRGSYLLPPNNYVVLTPFPEALPRLYPRSDAEVMVERIDFPSISPTYSEVTLYAHATAQVVDEMIYRRQWLGENSSDRTGFALERVTPTANGLEQGSWRRATENGVQKGTGGTPGLQNSVFGLPPTEEQTPHTPMDWPTEPTITYEQLEPMLHTFASQASLTLYSLTGDILMRASDTSIIPLLHSIKMGQLPLPSMIILVDVIFYDPTKEPAQVRYGGKWMHTK